MFRLIPALALLVALGLSAACSGNGSVYLDVQLDGHGDKYLQYSIWRVERHYVDPSDKTRKVEQIPGVKWKSLMNPSSHPDCSAAEMDVLWRETQVTSCQMSSSKGSATTEEAAREGILAHFERFKANNALRSVRTTPGS